MATIVSMHAWKSWIIPIRENTTWIERSKSKLSNHRCGAMHKIRIQLYHFPPPPFVPHSAWTIPSEQSFTSMSIYPISISRRQSVAITPFWRIEPIRYAWKKKNNRDYLARDIPLLSRNDQEPSTRMAKSNRLKTMLRNDRPVVYWSYTTYGTGGTPAPHFSALSQAISRSRKLAQLTYSYL